MLELDKETFEPEVLQASGKVFVDFYSDGCEPCKALMPVVEGLAEKYGDKLKFVKINTMKARRLAIAQKVLGLPVMAIYNNGEKITELVKDDCTEANIENMIKENL
ncbi:MAG: thioredoxin family protein [Oscillospiraceae bacterium]|nr:thioredoxin family protein [Oscillospiraceae bacterium]